MKVTIDGYTRFLLTAIAVLLTVLAVGLWFETPSTVPAAQAKIPDSGLQMNEMITRLDSVNKTLTELKVLMVSGAIKVQVVDPKADATVKAKPSPPVLVAPAAVPTP
ncbi:MAG: hypothetical protein JW810_04380 [Sedimentisphaerales bacterium]|nr:hypothetical protein [Sedimentisphaerales bacterium]